MRLIKKEQFSRLLMPLLREFLLGTTASLCLFSGSVVAAADSKPDSEPAEELVLASDIDVGVVFPFAMLDLNSHLTNIGSKAVRVERIAARWAGTQAKIDFTPASVKPGEAYQVGLKIQNGDGVGRFSHIFLLFDGKRDEPVGKIAVRGFTDWLIDPKSSTAELGVINAAVPVEQIVRPTGRPGVSFKLTRISEQNEMFEAKIVEDGKAVSLKTRPHMSWGPFDATIVVDTDNPVQRRVGIHAKGQVRGAIVPSMDVVEFGLVRVGEPSEQALRLVDQTGKKINIGKIDITGAAANAKVEDCVPKVESCRVVKLALSEKQMGSAPHGLMQISFPDYDAVLPIPFGGALVGKDTVVRDLQKEVDASRSSPNGISAALKSSVAPVSALEMPVPDGSGPLLKWEMANESPIYGYEIYRSDHSAGPFSRANAQIIPRLSEVPGVPSLYRWRDLSVKKGNEYWYYIGVVYLDGRKESLNSAQKVIAK